jgi:hypothetical protein
MSWRFAGRSRQRGSSSLTAISPVYASPEALQRDLRNLATRRGRKLARRLAAATRLRRPPKNDKSNWRTSCNNSSMGVHPRRTPTYGQENSDCHRRKVEQRRTLQQYLRLLATVISNPLDTNCHPRQMAHLGADGKGHRLHHTDGVSVVDKAAAKIASRCVPFASNVDQRRLSNAAVFLLISSGAAVPRTPLLLRNCHTVLCGAPPPQFLPR